MLITAYVFIGQQSHMSDMPLLHVICTTVKGNWYRLSRRLMMAAGCNDNCFICVLTDVYLLVWISSLWWDHICDNVNREKLVLSCRKEPDLLLNPKLDENQWQKKWSFHVHASYVLQVWCKSFSSLCLVRRATKQQQKWSDTQTQHSVNLQRLPLL